VAGIRPPCERSVSPWGVIATNRFLDQGQVGLTDVAKLPPGDAEEVPVAVVIGVLSTGDIQLFDGRAQ
jgi:hypothetical protein